MADARPPGRNPRVGLHISGDGEKVGRMRLLGGSRPGRVLSLLVALAAAVVFWISVMVYKYQIMFVYVSKVESGGVSKR